MTTTRDIVTKSLQKIGAITKNESPSADEINDGVSALNGFLGMISNESTMVYSRTIESFPVVANDGTYTIGPGGTHDFTTTRPTYIVEAYLTDGVTDYPLTIISDENYAEISDKTIASTPYWLNYNNGYSHGTIKLYPVPAKAYTLNIISEKPLTTFALDDVIDLPPGWEMMLIYNLAVILAPEYGLPVDKSIYKIAMDSKSAIQLNTLKSRSMDVNPSITFMSHSVNGYYK